MHMQADIVIAAVTLARIWHAHRKQALCYETDTGAAVPIQFCIFLPLVYLQPLAKTLGPKSTYLHLLLASCAAPLLRRFSHFFDCHGVFHRVVGNDSIFVTVTLRCLSCDGRLTWFWCKFRVLALCYTEHHDCHKVGVCEQFRALFSGVTFASPRFSNPWPAFSSDCGGLLVLS